MHQVSTSLLQTYQIVYYLSSFLAVLASIAKSRTIVHTKKAPHSRIVLGTNPRYKLPTPLSVISFNIAARAEDHVLPVMSD